MRREEMHSARLADAVHRAVAAVRQRELWILRGEIHSEWGEGEMRVELGPQAGLAELPDYQGRANFTGELGDIANS